jgi:hypothetical protein
MKSVRPNKGNNILHSPRPVILVVGAIQKWGAYDCPQVTCVSSRTRRIVR